MDIDSFIHERSYRYDFTKGELFVSFISTESAKIKLRVFRNCLVPDDVKAKLLEYRDECNTYAREIDMDFVRSLTVPEYEELKRTAYDEIKIAQYDTPGINIATNIRKFIPPNGFERIIFEDTCPISKVDPFPFNFGVRCRHQDDFNGPTYFFCVANDACRIKGKPIKLNHQVVPQGSRLLPVKQIPNETIVSEHVKGNHWEQLIQLGLV